MAERSVDRGSDLWQAGRDEARRAAEPLAVRMRPRTLAEFAGQAHILAQGKLLWRMLKADAITSMIFHGPPGTGKTTLASLIANQSKRIFVAENAASVGVKRIREIIDQATTRLEQQRTRTILFLDEIHRFTRAQQDVLLADVERGVITFIGATTENPLFSVNSALVSRSTLFRLEPLTVEEIKGVLRRAIADADRGFGKLDIRVSEEALDVWAIKSDGDARRALVALEVAVLSSAGDTPRPVASVNSTTGTLGHSATVSIDRQAAEDSIQQKAAVYDGTGDEHYDAASAMIKSVRGGDPDAAVYWIARMLEAGEDPRFIARRLAILASEDIGNADPHALPLASACFQIVERIGMPECRITLSQCACYLALCPKSNASYIAIEEAAADVREGRTVAVPMHIKDGNVRKASTLSAGSADRSAQAYQYSHDNPDAIGTQDYLGVEKNYYRPVARGMEQELSERLAKHKQARQDARSR
ncbi:MAG: replication-associated recombination protein A [Planctomycetota bacterium]|nr:replication-associated recombination protein A [Planctomycetota bacterium]